MLWSENLHICKKQIPHHSILTLNHHFCPKYLSMINKNASSGEKVYLGLSSNIKIHKNICFSLAFAFKHLHVFSRRLYPKPISNIHSGYNLIFISMCVPWELNPFHPDSDKITFSLEKAILSTLAWTMVL